MSKLIAPQHSKTATSEPGMVYELWNDGEVTLTKSGELYRMRNLHQNYPAFSQCDMCLGLPNIEKPFYVVAACQEREDIFAARTWLSQQYHLAKEPMSIVYNEHNKAIEAILAHRTVE